MPGCDRHCEEVGVRVDWMGVMVMVMVMVRAGQRRVSSA